MPSFPWSALFLILSLGMAGLAASHALSGQFSDQFAAGVLVPLGLVGVLVWAVALRMLTGGKRSHKG